jgi:amidase
VTDDLSRIDATAQAELVSSGQASPLELVEAAIERIERINPEINAVIHPLFDRARAEAAGDLPDGPFRGVPFLLKDFAAELAGTPFNEGTRLSGDYISTDDQELTRRFQQAGLVICGKTNTPEFGILPTTEPERFGPTRNPWDRTRSTGGSSGGSAAAVASGMVPVAHANDGGGSIRIPASCCGLVGLKPSRARVSLAPRYGDVMGGLVAEHVVTRSVRDSAAMLDAIAGPSPGDPYAVPALRGESFAAAAAAAPARLRIAIMVDSPTGSVVDPDCVAATVAAGELCASLGHEVVEAAPAIDGDALTSHFINMWAAGNAWVMLDWEERIGRAGTPDDVEPLTWALVEMGRAVGAGQYLRSVQELQKVGRTIGTFLETYDLILTPTLGEPPVPLGTFDSPPDSPLDGLFRSASYVPFTPVFNVTGQPAISLPLHQSDAGLPIGVQFAARLGDEETLLSLAGQLETAAPWADRRPPIHA